MQLATVGAFAQQSPGELEALKAELARRQELEDLKGELAARSGPDPLAPINPDGTQTLTPQNTAPPPDTSKPGLRESIAQGFEKFGGEVGNIITGAQRPNNQFKEAVGGFAKGQFDLGALAVRDPAAAWDVLNPVAQGGRAMNETGQAVNALGRGEFGEAGQHGLNALNEASAAALTIVPLAKGAMAPKPVRGPTTADVGQTLETHVVPGQPIRPQAVVAIQKILRNSGVPADYINLAIKRAGEAFSNGQEFLAGRAATFAQLLERELVEKYPQAQDNIRLALRERGLTAKRGDQSPSIVRETTQAMRAEQTPFLKRSAEENLGANSRNATREEMAADLERIGKEAYKPLLAAPTDPKRATAIQGILGGPGMEEFSRPLKQIAAAEGLDLETFVRDRPVEAAHWYQHKARLLAEDAGNKGNKTLANAYNSVRSRILETLDDIPVPGQPGRTYKDIRTEYGDAAGVGTALDMGNQFGGQVRNPEGAKNFIEKFKGLTPEQQSAGLQSIGDWVHQVLNGAPEDAPARIATLVQQGVLDALDQLGPAAQRIAADIRSIRSENDFLTATTNRGQSATIPNAQALKEGPKLYSGGPGAMGPVGTDAIGMASGAYNGPINTALKLGGTLFDKIGRPLIKTREDMTRVLMARQNPSPRNALSEPPPPIGGKGPPKLSVVPNEPKISTLGNGRTPREEITLKFPKYGPSVTPQKMLSARAIRNPSKADIYKLSVPPRESGLPSSQHQEVRVFWDRDGNVYAANGYEIEHTGFEDGLRLLGIEPDQSATIFREGDKFTIFRQGMVQPESFNPSQLGSSPKSPNVLSEPSGKGGPPRENVLRGPPGKTTPLEGAYGRGEFKPDARPKFNTRASLKDAPPEYRDVVMTAPEGVSQREWDAVRNSTGTGRLPSPFTLGNRIVVLERKASPTPAELRTLKAMKEMKSRLEKLKIDFE